MMGINFYWKSVLGQMTYIIQKGEISKDDPLLLIIPGNPGVADFYLEFMECLAKDSMNNLPMVCISHAGHVTPPKTVTCCGKMQQLSLSDQIRHKLEFIESSIPASTPLILIGHSIGCHMILQMLKSLNEKRVLKCFFLFPTIEWMSESPQGKVVTPLLLYLRWILPLFTYPIYYLIPDSVKRYLVDYLYAPVPECIVDGVLRLASPTTLWNCASLANNEMQVVREADYDLLSSHIDKIHFYYGAEDHWCPVEFYQRMKDRFPGAEIHLCKNKIAHAFVLKSSAEMATLIRNLIETKYEYFGLNQLAR